MCKMYDYCDNKKSCDDCDSTWKDKFIPNESVNRFFIKAYVGRGGINGRSYSFNTTDEKIQPTKSVVIDGRHYCPYCAVTMFNLQDKSTLEVIGHRCLCEGAMAEIEHSEKLNELKLKHNQEYMALNNQFKDKLAVDINKLFEIKQTAEKNRFNFFNKNTNLTSYRMGDVTELENIIF